MVQMSKPICSSEDLSEVVGKAYRSGTREEGDSGSTFESLSSTAMMVWVSNPTDTAAYSE